MEMIKDALAKVGSTVTDFIEATKDSTIGAIALVLVVGIIVWLVL